MHVYYSVTLIIFLLFKQVLNFIITCSCTCILLHTRKDSFHSKGVGAITINKLLKRGKVNSTTIHKYMYLC